MWHTGGSSLMRRFLTLSALALLGIALLACGLVYHYGPRLVFFGAHFDDTNRPTLADRMPEMQRVAFTTADGTVLRGWLRDCGQGSPLVVAYGGNNMNVGDFAGLARLAAHSSFLLLNHRGYGESEGVPSEEAVVSDARQALHHFRAQLGQPERVIVLGFSLGTGVATQVAATEPIDQLILACPFDSVAATGRQHVGSIASILPLPAFRSDLAAEQVSCPVTIIMATQDTIVPNERTLELLRHFRHAQLRKVDCGHNEAMFRAETLECIQPLIQGLR